jgi:hypothetical protein
MSISSIGGCSAAQTTQATQYRSTSSAASTSTASAAQDGSSFINAIASALSDIGVTSSASADPGTAAADANTDPAKALGDFLHTLMDTLHAQGGGPQGAGGPPPPPPSGGGKGGGIESDLQSLISSLGTTDTESTSDSTDSAGTDLAASFKNLLGALGMDSADSSSKLGQFLQTLSAKLETSGPSGNLINTTA